MRVQGGTALCMAGGGGCCGHSWREGRLPCALEGFRMVGLGRGFAILSNGPFVVSGGSGDHGRRLYRLRKRCHTGGGVVICYAAALEWRFGDGQGQSGQPGSCKEIQSWTRMPNIQVLDRREDGVTKSFQAMPSRWRYLFHGAL
jgi:hypothetical protein